MTPRHTFIMMLNIDDKKFCIESIRHDILQLHKVAEKVDYRFSLQHPYNFPKQSQVFIAEYNDKQPQLSDRVFVYLTSDDEQIPNRIVASGFVSRIPKISPYNEFPIDYSEYKTEVELDVILDPLHELHLLHQSILELQFPDYDWSSKAKDFILDSETALLLEMKWYDYLSRVSEQLPSAAFWCQSKYGFQSMYNWVDENGNYDMGHAALYIKNLNMEKYLAQRTK